MRRNGLFPSAFLNTVFFIVWGTLKNGERCVDAASLDQLQHLQVARQHDMGRSRLLARLTDRGNAEYEDSGDNMQMIASRSSQAAAKLGQLVDTSVRRDDESGLADAVDKHRTRPKRQAPRHEDLQMHHKKHAAPCEYGYRQYCVEITLGEEMKHANLSIEDTMQRLKEALADLLKWNETSICVGKINFATKQVELLFNCPGEETSVGQTRLPTTKITSHANLLKDLQIAVPELKINNISTYKGDGENGMSLTVYGSPAIWMQPYFPYIVTGGSILIVFVLSVVTYACFCRAKDNLNLMNSTDGLGSQHLYHQQQQQQQQQQQHILFPDVIAPDTGSPLAIQPCAAPLFVPVGYTTTPVPAQPIRIKRKGLLESRRGSNASLTLDLQPSPEIGRWDGTPPKESTGLEYLMSAGNRLSRRDLRNATKNTKILYEEFWEIPMNHPEKVSVAGSGMKNRYKTIIPNEHTLVVLPDADQDPLSSYINANYIRGYEREMHAYVATQGPMAHTIEDFWQMVWHQRAPIIVMITKLKEKSKPKCENYLPEHYGIYGDIEVTVTKVIQKKGYVVRHLHLKSEGESRLLLHFWYTAWPDHKPPDSPSMLLELVKEVELRRYRTDGITPRGPVVVHCSAGIGRTGCFVAISIGIRQLREEHSVDILGVVCGMRLDRGGMIQTHEQYDFVHQALCEYERTLGEPSIQSLTALTSDGH
ncbi:hypothetical protein ACOMHN_029037 [Nucella lapillus]